MGVPRFFRWLSERYPMLNQAVGQGLKPAFDNLYLDMNGIVHNCTHANGGVDSDSLTEDMMFERIFQYIDKLFALVKPQKLIYMAIDGVAPRAKMNQQRQRRFRSAQAAEQAAAEAAAKGESVKADRFDSNCITPGTPFMERLSAHIRYFIRAKLHTDASWRKVKVVFSGAESVGEGEHKIMRYMRAMRMQPGYDPNTRHCLYGLDADLIMLSLASHEHHVALLREEVVFGAPSTNTQRKRLVRPDEFNFLHISLLREYLELELRPDAALPFAWDRERMVDDVVALCFLVGNDFLPPLPTAEVGDGGVASLFEAYKTLLPLLGGWLTNAGTMHVGRLCVVLGWLATKEEAVFAQKAKDEERMAARGYNNFGKSNSNNYNKKSAATAAWAEPEAPAADVAIPSSDDEGLEDDDDLVDGPFLSAPFADNEEGAAELASTTLTAGNYYRRKFHRELPKAATGIAHGDTSKPLHEDIKTVCHAYLEGVLWCLKYYYAGVPSWRWHYPYRHAPLASSLIRAGLPQASFNFTLGAPFSPLEQLLGVLPPQSAQLVPAGWRSLMTDPLSPVKQFYPDTFEVDRDGAKAEWEGLALIPFIEEKALLSAVHALPADALTPQEQRRNRNAETDWLFQYDPAESKTYHLAAAYSEADTGAGAAGAGGATEGVDAGVSAPISPYPVNTALFPPLVRCCSRAEPFAQPLVPAFPWWTASDATTTAAMAAMLTQLNADDARLLSISYAEPADTPTSAENKVSEGRFLTCALPGAIMPVAGWPSLFFLPEVTGVFPAPVRVNLFGRDARNPSVAVVSPPTQESLSGAAVSATIKVGTRVFCDYPFLREGLVARVQDESTVWDTDSAFGRPPSQKEKGDWVKASRDVATRLTKKQSVDHGPARVLVFVRPLLGMAVDADGSARKRFSPNTLLSAAGYESEFTAETPSFGGGKGGYKGGNNNNNNGGTTYTYLQDRVCAFAAQTVFAAHPFNRPDPRWAERPAPSATEKFPPGTTVVCVGEKGYGSTGSVVSVDEQGSGAGAGAGAGATVTVRIVKRPALPPALFRNIVAKGALGYFPSHVVSRHLGLHGAALARLCSSLCIEPGNKEVGLCLVFSRQGLCVPDYARRVDAWQASDDARERERGAGEQWEYSELTVTLLQDMMTAFPAFFRYLNENPHGYKINASHFAAAGESAEACVERIAKWVKALAVTSLVAVPASSVVASARASLWAEKKALEYGARLHATLTGKEHSGDPLEPLAEGREETVTLRPWEIVPINATPAFSPTAPADGTAVSELGDRVCSLRSDEGVPAGCHGTVVGVHAGGFLEVVWDRAFAGGSTLQGKCLSARGRTVSEQAVLNLASPKPVTAAAGAFKQVKGKETSAGAGAGAAPEATSGKEGGKQQQQGQQQQQGSKPQAKLAGAAGAGAGAGAGDNKQQQGKKAAAKDNNSNNSDKQQQQQGQQGAAAGAGAAKKSYDTLGNKGGKQQQQQQQQQQQGNSNNNGKGPKPAPAAAPAAPAAASAVPVSVAALLGTPAAAAAPAAAKPAASPLPAGMSAAVAMQAVRAGALPPAAAAAQLSALRAALEPEGPSAGGAGAGAGGAGVVAGGYATYDPSRVTAFGAGLYGAQYQHQHQHQYQQQAYGGYAPLNVAAGALYSSNNNQQQQQQQQQGQPQPQQQQGQQQPRY